MTTHEQRLKQYRRLADLAAQLGLTDWHLTQARRLCERCGFREAVRWLRAEGRAA